MKSSKTPPPNAENAKLGDNLYFYHPDHLGSTNLITNFDGEVTQSVAYVPYGEVFVEERNGNWASPFLFNAKELDEETGLYYYGARYLDPAVATWLSVDPKWDDYKGVSPYAYCLNNPVKLVDPNGKEFTEAGEEWAKALEKRATEELEKAKEGSKAYEEYKATLNEISDLRASKQVYDVREYNERPTSDGQDLRGFVSYDQDKDMFVVNINTDRDVQTESSQMGAFAHELKHAYQYENGRLSFKKNPEGGVTKSPGFLYDLTDEIEAHQRGRAFGAGSVVPSSEVYPKLKSNETHIGVDNCKQYEKHKERKGKDLLEDNVFRYNN